MRIFADLPLSDSFKNSLETQITTLRNNHPDLHWIPDENLHITLTFLGDVNETGVRLLAEVLKAETTTTKRIQIRSSHLLTLPKRKPANVLALGFDRGQNEVADLADRIECKLEQLTTGGQYAFRPRENRQFTTHLTIARKGRNPIRLLQNELEPLHIETVIDKAILFQSELHREGAVYTPLAEFVLS
jgi:2'-5' RNA ligase